MNKIKITHIHSDLKFVGNSKRFENEQFDNTIIIIGDKAKYKGVYNETALFFKNSIRDYNKVIEICKKSQLVVLYDLNFSKSYIANRLPNSVKVIWRFFGLELYSKMPKYVFSDKTLSIKKNNRKKDIYSFIRKVFSFIKFRTYYEREFNSAIKRADHFLGISDLEHKFLIKYWPDLPDFIQHPLSFEYQNDIIEKLPQIIIGNNRSAYNNHIDIIELLDNEVYKKNIKYLLFFSYGTNDKYTDIVREKGKQNNKIDFIESFLEISSFNEIYKQSAALVINSYRQMAMFNIFTAFRNNVKVYLNKKNIMYDWLTKEGFAVSTIDDLVPDLQNHRFYFTIDEIAKNRKTMELMNEKYNEEKFHSIIIKLALN